MFHLKNIFHSYISSSNNLPQELSIMKGEHLLLLGPSGCGKTTLMNMMATLMPIEGGEINFCDTPYSTLQDKDKDKMREEHFGFIFQRHHLIPHLSVEQNISVVQRHIDTGFTASLIKTVGLEGKDQQKARSLSVGEAQRVAIARALANKPKVIFADEPTSALDNGNAKQIMGLIFDQARETGASVIAATHDARIKPHFKTILEMQI